MSQEVKKFVILCLVIVSVIGADDENEVIKSKSIDARTMLEKITSTLMSRSGSTSQVLSLNLTNLLILVLLKTLIFTAGSFGAGGWKGGYGGYGHGGGYGRNSDDSEERFVSDSEILLYLGYLSGSPGKYQCLQNVACNRPKQALQYVKAGGLLLKAASFLPGIVDVDATHDQTLRDLKKAAEIGQSGGSCDSEFACANDKTKEK